MAWGKTMWRTAQTAMVIAVTPVSAKIEQKPYVVVSYLPEWRYEHADWETISEVSTHVLLFSLEPSPEGNIVAKDRLPSARQMQEAREASRRHGAQLLICFGGNGRSAGFSPMARNINSRRRFIKKLAALISQYDLDGVDYNWEYPGYSFRSGYMPEEEVEMDYAALADLVRETKNYFNKKQNDKTVTLAYYPDGRQERLLKSHGIADHADLMHMMSYDQNGQHHSTEEYAHKTADQGAAILPPGKLTLGVPFYGRNSATGDWVTYEDLVRDDGPLDPAADAITRKSGGPGKVGFNGLRTIGRKTEYALNKGLGGIMIWEVGQDCRWLPADRRTCRNKEDALLRQISSSAAKTGRVRQIAAATEPAGTEDNNGNGQEL